jgi:hypothetical protein
MSDFLLLLVFGVCWTWGIHCLFGEGYLLEPAGRWIQRQIPKWLFKPLLACPPCMASIHGFFISAIYYDWRIIHMGAFMICLCGLNFILKSILYPEYE